MSSGLGVALAPDCCSGSATGAAASGFSLGLSAIAHERWRLARLGERGGLEGTRRRGSAAALERVACSSAGFKEATRCGSRARKMDREAGATARDEAGVLEMDCDSQSAGPSSSVVWCWAMGLWMTREGKKHTRGKVGSQRKHSKRHRASSPSRDCHKSTTCVPGTSQATAFFPPPSEHKSPDSGHTLTALTESCTSLCHQVTRGLR